MNQKLHEMTAFNLIARDLRGSGCFVLAEHVQLFYENDEKYLRRLLFEKELEVIFLLNLNFFVFSGNCDNLSAFNIFLEECYSRLQRLDCDLGHLYDNGIEKVFKCKYFLPSDLDYSGICLFLVVLLSSLEKLYQKANVHLGINAIKINLDEITKSKKYWVNKNDLP